MENEIRRTLESAVLDRTVDGHLRDAAARWLAVDAAFSVWCGWCKWAGSHSARVRRAGPSFDDMFLEIDEMDEALLDAWRRYEHQRTQEVLQDLLRWCDDGVRRRLVYLSA